MSKWDDLLSFDVWELSQKLRAREVSPVEVTGAYLGRIEALEPELHAYITVTAEIARESAQQAENEIASGRWRGTFHGVPVALKDLCCTKGIRTTGGSRILADFVPDHDATVWARLAAQGAVLLGKLNLHEFAYGATSTNPHWGAVHNPYKLERIAGGSSGGSAAAIVAKTAAATIGTDTGGSIRIPAALCGCVGFKPTWSRVSRHGVIPLADTLDHVGPITRTVRDAALMLGVIAGPDPEDSTASREPVPNYVQALEGDIKRMRVGVIKELNDGLADEVAGAFDAALKQIAALGASVGEVSMPSVVMGAPVTRFVMIPEALEWHERWLRERPRDYGDDVRERLEMGMAITATDYIRAQRARARMLAEALDALSSHDVLVAPVSEIAAPLIDRPASPLDPDTREAVDMTARLVRFTAPFDATGQPALALPTGFSSDGLPLSMQIIGKPFDEATVCRVAAAYERARGPLPAPKLDGAPARCSG